MWSYNGKRLSKIPFKLASVQGYISLIITSRHKQGACGHTRERDFQKYHSNIQAYKAIFH
jgi:hypothetical protein